MFWTAKKGWLKWTRQLPHNMLYQAYQVNVDEWFSICSENIGHTEQLTDKYRWYHSYKENGKMGDAKYAKDEAGIPPSKENYVLHKIRYCHNFFNGILYRSPEFLLTQQFNNTSYVPFLKPICVGLYIYLVYLFIFSFLKLLHCRTEHTGPYLSWGSVRLVKVTFFPKGGKLTLCLRCIFEYIWT